MRRASVALAATLAVGSLVALGGCGASADVGEKIDLTDQFVTKQKKPIVVPADGNLSARERRAKRIAEATPD